MRSARLRRAMRRAVPAIVIVSVTVALAPVPVFVWLRFADVPATSFQLQDLLRAEDPDGRPATTRVGSMDIEDVSRAMIAVTVANEDGRLGERRGGVNWGEQWDRSEDPTLHGSSIPQQYVKNLLLFRHKSPARKAVEGVWAELFAYIVPPRRQLELYLNSIEFGPGTWGICEASWAIVGKPPSDLTFTEAVALLQQLPDPKHRTYVPLDDAPVTRQRVDGHGGGAAISARFGIVDLASEQADPTCATPAATQPLQLGPPIYALLGVFTVTAAGVLAVTAGAVAWVFGWDPRRRPRPTTGPPLSLPPEQRPIDISVPRGPQPGQW